MTAASSNRRAVYWMLALALVGIADAFYVASSSYAGQPLREFFIEGANTVLNSPYARIAGVPLSYLGLMFYAHMFALALLLAVDPSSRGLRLGALLYSAMGVCASGYFMYLQLNYIRALCIYCMLSAVLTVLLFITALRQLAAARQPASSFAGLARPSGL
jgi:uncharacterized membrane protein